MSLASDGIEILHVPMGDRSYDIHVGDGAIGRAGTILKDILRAPRVVIVTDENVAPDWLGPLEKSLDEAGIRHRAVVLPPGEHTKSMQHLEELLDDLLANNIDRKTTLVALGGGVVGDLTGFAAAVVMRGVDFVQIPTTLLAQVDSSVGGKTGIDTRYGKNLIGAFHQPRAVIADTLTLNTLPMRERLCGYAEVVKYGVINDREFFDWLQTNGRRILDGDAAARREAVLRSCANKAEIVAADEREAGLRALLNLGHTFAHALEAQVGFEDKLKHGEAVAIGMVMALDLSVRLAMISETDRDVLKAHLEDVGLPTDIRGLAGGNWTADVLLEHMGRDKKTQDGKLTFILARGIGNSFVANDVDPGTVATVLESYINDAR
ncbi:MAG: 3-dehydroquinate synthase [Rhodospirillales bacterium]|nr:3-dehydroquinate synthase [Rhodospirillales bacterium]MBO6786118.1 3-dehydroquinate synthase [Rhodospirillales bacterium]